MTIKGLTPKRSQVNTLVSLGEKKLQIVRFKTHRTEANLVTTVAVVPGFRVGSASNAHILNRCILETSLEQPQEGSNLYVKLTNRWAYCRTIHVDYSELAHYIHKVNVARLIERLEKTGVITLLKEF